MSGLTRIGCALRWPGRSNLVFCIRHSTYQCRLVQHRYWHSGLFVSSISFSFLVVFDVSRFYISSFLFLLPPFNRPLFLKSSPWRAASTPQSSRHSSPLYVIFVAFIFSKLLEKLTAMLGRNCGCSEYPVTCVPHDECFADHRSNRSKMIFGCMFSH